MHNGALNSTLLLTELTSTSMPTVHPLPENESEQQSYTLQLILVLLAVTAIIIIMSALVIYYKKRRNDQLRHYLMPLYTFDASDDDQDWETETELLENSLKLSLKKGYKSMEFPPSLIS